jgi:hypothetical protein
MISARGIATTHVGGGFEELLAVCSCSLSVSLVANVPSMFRNYCNVTGKE